MTKDKKRNRIIFDQFLAREQIIAINAVIRNNRQSKHFVIIADVQPSEGLLHCAMITEADAKGVIKALKVMKKNTVPVNAVMKEARK